VVHLIGVIMNQSSELGATVAAAELQVVIEAGKPDPTWARDAARWLGERRPWARLVVVDDPCEVALGAGGTPILTFEPCFLAAPQVRRPGWVLYYLDAESVAGFSSHFIGGEPDLLDTALTEAQSWLSVLRLQADAECILRGEYATDADATD